MFTNTAKALLPLLFLLLSTSAAQAGLRQKSDDICYTRQDSATIVNLLAEAPKGMSNGERMLYFGKKLRGTPYVAHTLEVGDRERLVVNTRQLDCTTFLETVIALAICDKDKQRTFESFCGNLRKIRYRGGKINGYPSRLHYFAWWADDNADKGIVKEVASESYPFTSTMTINVDYMSTHPKSYKQLNGNAQLTKEIRRLEEKSNGKTIRYIPKKLLNGGKDKLGAIHTGDIIAIVTSKKGLDTSHLGIAVWQDGKLHLMHASSLYHKVVLDSKTFYAYTMNQKSQTGIRVYRLAY